MVGNNTILEVVTITAAVVGNNTKDWYNSNLKYIRGDSLVFTSGEQFNFTEEIGGAADASIRMPEYI